MLTVGCDPEFILINEQDSKEHVSFSHTIEGVGTIGRDHCGRVGELRPNSGTPQQVTTNIKKMFQWIKQNYPTKKVVAGGGQNYSESIGGHIHIGGLEFHGYTSVTRWRSRRRSGRYRSYGDNSEVQQNKYNVDTMTDKQKLVYALDFFLGRRLKRVSGAQRGSKTYGKYGDIETKPHGFEYRTPPSWLTDPLLTESTLAVALRVVELWKVKPTVFDIFIENRKRSARKRDFQMLIGVEANSAYMQRQIKNYIRVIFSKSYKMDNKNLLDLWTTTQKPIVVEEHVNHKSKKITQNINLQICQLKIVDQETTTRSEGEGFKAESVAKVIRFAIPEVKIYPLGDYPPWQFQLVKDIRLRPDTLYFSKELRPFLKIKRGTIRTRFVELKRRTANGHEAMENVVFYNNIRSELDMQAEVIKVFELGTRTKLRREVDSE